MRGNDQHKFKVVVSCIGAGSRYSQGVGHVTSPLLTLFYPEAKIQESSLSYSLYFFCMSEMLVILF